MRFGFPSVSEPRDWSLPTSKGPLVVERYDFEKSSAGTSAHPESDRLSDPKHLHAWSDGRPPATELVFIDPAVEDIEGLIAGLRQNVEPCVLDDCSPAIAQMATALRGKVAQVEAIHIIAHGRPGEVSFSAGAVSLETVGAYAADLDLIGRSLGTPAKCCCGAATPAKALAALRS
jgi:hypothetical protein